MCINKDHAFVDEAIESMLCQDFDSDYEVIIVANNCTDDLYEKLELYAGASKHIKLYRTSIGQLAFNLNYGVDKALGQYIVRMDSDDVSMPDRLTNTLKSLREYNYPDLLAAKAYLINDVGDALGESGKAMTPNEIHKALRYKNPIVHPTSSIKKQSILKARGYLGGINCEDRDLWLRMDRSGMRLLVDDFFAIHYRISDVQVKGSRIAYADNAGLLLREALYRKSLPYGVGAFVACLKFIFLSMLRKMK